MNWILWLFGKRVRTTITFECGDSDCGHTHSIKIWHKPEEDAYEVLQKEVQAEFEKAEQEAKFLDEMRKIKK